MKAHLPLLLMKGRLSPPFILVICHMTMKEKRVEAPFNLIIFLECVFGRIVVSVKAQRASSFNLFIITFFSLVVHFLCATNIVFLACPMKEISLSYGDG